MLSTTGKEVRMLYLGVTRKGASAHHRILSDYELSRGKSKNRGLTIVEAGPWDIEKQKDLATKYRLCPLLLPIMDGETRLGYRICGDYLRDRKDGYSRTKCGSCNGRTLGVAKLSTQQVNEFAPKGRQVLFEGEAKKAEKHMLTSLCGEVLEKMKELEITQEENKKMKLERTVFEEKHDELQSRIDALKAEVVKANSALDQGPTLLEIIQTRWKTKGSVDDKDFKPQTYNNGKCHTKKFAAALGMTLNTRRRIFLETVEGPQKIHDTIRAPTYKDQVNGFVVIRGVLGQCGMHEWATDLVNMEKTSDTRPKQIGCHKPLGTKHANRIEKMLKHFKIDLNMVHPGKALLSVIQEALMAYEPQNQKEHVWFVHNLFGFFLPGGRDGVHRLKFTTSLPQNDEQYQESSDNLVLVDEEANVVRGIYFGGLKKSSKRYSNGWKKRYILDEEGAHFHYGLFPVTHCDYSAVWKKITASLDFIWNKKSNKSKLHKLALSKVKMGSPAGRKVMYVNFFGTLTGSQVERKVFRNGNPKNMSDAWIKNIMQHRIDVDISDYVKPRLMDGPWTQ
jgi:hypothetical protein